MIALLAATALAEDPVFTGTQKTMEGAEKPEAHLGAELGGSASSGNTSFYTVSTAANGSYKWTQNKVGFTLAGVYGRGRVDADASGSLSPAERAADPVAIAGRAALDVRYDRFFAEVNSVYALAGGLIDPYAGYDLRTHEQLGYSRTFVKTEDVDFVGELGFDYAQENYVDGVSPNYADIYAAREMLAVTAQLNENLGVSEQVEVYENLLDLNDIRLLNTAAILVKATKVLNLKLGHTLIYDNVPVEGFGPLDSTITATLVASIL
jgi:putative salt-induced outer membrane protein YdiY